MKINNLILVLFITIFFNACYKKVDRTSLNEDYKTLNQISVIGTPKYTAIRAFKPYGIFPPCPFLDKENNFWLNSIIDRHTFGKILEAKGIEVLDFGKPVKRLIFIKPISYSTHNCSPDFIYVDFFLYDVEDISKTWDLKSNEDILKEINLLGDRNLIYTNRYKLDINFNPRQALDFNFIRYWWNSTSVGDVKKFFNRIVEDLEKVVKFPYSLNP